MNISPVKLITTKRYMTIDQHRRWIYGRVAVERAYAKLNLGLKVIKKRDDGYHDLDMLNCEINIFDDIICYDTKLPIEIISNVNICKKEDNLVYKVAKEIIKRFELNNSVKIEINKRIPFGAGLAGGSSDAAATIRALNRLWDLKMTSSEMLDIAASIGSDVPYLVEGGIARVSGVGNIIDTLESGIQFYVILVTPDYKSYTKDVFNQYKFYNSLNDINSLVDACRSNQYENFVKLLHNDLQDVVTESARKNGLITPVEIATALVEYGCDGAMMTGSGSSVFGVSQDVFTAKKVYNKIKIKYPSFDVAFTKILKEKPTFNELEKEFFAREKESNIFLR